MVDDKDVKTFLDESALSREIGLYSHVHYYSMERISGDLVPRRHILRRKNIRIDGCESNRMKERNNNIDLIIFERKKHSKRHS